MTDIDTPLLRSEVEGVKFLANGERIDRILRRLHVAGHHVLAEQAN